MNSPIVTQKNNSPQITGGRYNASSPSLTDGQGTEAQFDNEGNLLVNIAVGGGGGGVSPAVGLTNATAPTSAIETGMVDAGGKLQAVSAANPIPVAQQGSVAVTGTFWQTTQPVNAGDVIDATNSSTTPLAGGAVFTGTAKATAGFSQLIVAVDTDQPSASTSTTGIFVQWSEDGTNWGDYDGGSFSSSDVGLGQGYSYPIKRAYYRVVYTNGATLQTYFRLQSILKVNTSVGRLIDLIDTIDPNTHAQVVRSRQFGASAYGGGTFNDSVIKNPSTAAAATDPALVVSVSPNSPVPCLAATALPTAATGGNPVDTMADKFGRLVILSQAPRNLVQPLILSNSSASSPANFGTVGGTGVYLDLASFIVTNRSATATVVSLTDGTLTYTFAIAANGGLVHNPSVPIPASATATQWQVSNSGGVACDYIALAIQNK